MREGLFVETKLPPRGWFGSAFSFSLHACTLAWVAFGPAGAPREKQASAYEQFIKPNEKKLVWYRFSDKLPESAPQRKTAGPPKADTRAKQSMVVEGGRKSGQMVWQPLPNVELPRELPSPNIVAMRVPQAPQKQPPRLFAPPREALREAIPDLLPEAPRVPAGSGAAVPTLAESAREAHPRARPFVPPEFRRAAASSNLPQAPAIPAGTASAAPILNRDALTNRPRPRDFVAPGGPSRPQQDARPLPQAPGVNTVSTSTAPILNPGALTNRPRPRDFVAPGGPSRPASGAQALPQAPQMQAASAAQTPVLDPGALDARPRAMPFRAPTPRRVEPLPPVIEEAPAIMASVSKADVNAAIVGLRPASRLDAPLPEGSRQADFSAGPKLSAEGGPPESNAMLSVPGLAVSDGPQAKTAAEPVLMARASPTSSENLMAAVRAAPPSTISQAGVTALRVATAPDPRLTGRTVYSLAVQMPNITSYYGSWMLWFAERDPARGAGLRPPVPTRKVDPRYVPSAVEEKIEGSVQLAAIIRSDGTVAGISVLRSLDSRLDFAATEALSKWLFQPALRDGSAVDVDAIVEVPFRLAPPELRYK
jgi:TonB family protein